MVNDYEFTMIKLLCRHVMGTPFTLLYFDALFVLSRNLDKQYRCGDVSHRIIHVASL